MCVKHYHNTSTVERKEGSGQASKVTVGTCALDKSLLPSLIHMNSRHVALFHILSLQAELKSPLHLGMVAKYCFDPTWYCGLCIH